MNEEVRTTIRDALQELMEYTDPDLTEVDIDMFKTTWNKLERYLVDQKINADEPKKKQRMIPMNERCMAKRANGGRCTRRRKNEFFCGTHCKSTKDGMVNDMKEVGDIRELLITNIDIRGITYFADQDKYLYMPSDILKSAPQPRIIGRYALNELNEPYLLD